MAPAQEPNGASPSSAPHSVEQVFEINCYFRNEGIDYTHSPEFAMLYRQVDTGITLGMLGNANSAHRTTRRVVAEVDHDRWR